MDQRVDVCMNFSLACTLRITDIDPVRHPQESDKHQRRAFSGSVRVNICIYKVEQDWIHIQYKSLVQSSAIYNTNI